MAIIRNNTTRSQIHMTPPRPVRTRKGRSIATFAQALYGISVSNDKITRSCPRHWPRGHDDVFRLHGTAENSGQHASFRRTGHTGVGW